LYNEGYDKAAIEERVQAAATALTTTYCSLLAARCSLLTARCSLLAAHCSLLTALLPAHCLLLYTTQAASRAASRHSDDGCCKGGGCHG